MAGRFDSSFGHDFSFLFRPDRRRVRIVIRSQKDSRLARHRIARNVFVPARSSSPFARALTIVRSRVPTNRKTRGDGENETHFDFSRSAHEGNLSREKKNVSRNGQ